MRYKLTVSYDGYNYMGFQIQNDLDTIELELMRAFNKLLNVDVKVYPSGRTLPLKTYNKLKKQIKFELGAIAYHCKEVYLADPYIYDDYILVEVLKDLYLKNR